MKKYYTADRETGKLIESFSSIEEALAAVTVCLFGEGCESRCDSGNYDILDADLNSVDWDEYWLEDIKKFGYTLSVEEIIAAAKAIQESGAYNDYEDPLGLIPRALDRDFLTFNTARSGYDVAWYVDPGEYEACVRVDTLEVLSKEEIFRQFV